MSKQDKKTKEIMGTILIEGVLIRLKQMREELDSLNEIILDMKGQEQEGQKDQMEDQTVPTEQAEEVGVTKKGRRRLSPKESKTIGSSVFI